MPANRGQGKTTRWYQLCFVPTSTDSSDDSDIESVAITPTTPIQSNTVEEIFPLSPLLLPPPPPLPPNLECETDELPLPLSLQDFLPHQPLQGASATPTPTSTWQEPSLPSSPPDPEPEIDWSLLLPPPPPPDFVPRQPLQRVMARIFNIEVQQDSHMFEGDQQDCNMDSRNGISKVRVSKIDKFSHCPICMDEFTVGDQACQLPCTHSYCSECILRWLNSSKTCPICRLQLNGYGSVSKNDNNGLDST